MDQAGLWNLGHSIEALPTEGDPREQLDRTKPFEPPRPHLRHRANSNEIIADRSQLAPNVEVNPLG